MNEDLKKALDEALAAQKDPAACRRKLEDLLAGPLAALPEDENHVLWRAIALDALGRALFALGEPEEALARLREGMTCLKTSAEKNVENSALAKTLSGLARNLSFACLESGLFGESREAGGQALFWAQKAHSGDSPELAGASFGLSALFYRLKDYEKAENLCLRALDIWQKAGNGEKAATCMNNLGRICEERGDMAAGIEWHRKALALRENLPDKADLAFSCGNLGVALASAGEWAEAAKTLAHALEIYEALGMRGSREYAGYARNLEICQTALENERE